MISDESEFKSKSAAAEAEAPLLMEEERKRNALRRFEAAQAPANEEEEEEEYEEYEVLAAGEESLAINIIAGRQGSKGGAGGKTNDQDISGSFKFSNTILPQHVTATAQQLLPTSVLRNLYDKLYEKRKAAALEVEQIVKSLAGAGDLHRVHALLSLLVRDYALSPLSNHRKGKNERFDKRKKTVSARLNYCSRIASFPFFVDVQYYQHRT